VNTTGAALDWAVSLLGYEGHAAMAADADRFRRGWRRTPTASDRDHREAAPLFLPYLGDGDRDDAAVRGAFVGLSARHDRAAVAYAVLEGVAFGVRATLTVLQEAGSPLEELRAGGGGAKTPLVGQLKADVLGRPVLHLDGDAAAIGTAMLAGAAAGIGEDARRAIALAVGRARRFDPDPWGMEVGAVRAKWFDDVRADRAIRMPEA